MKRNGKIVEAVEGYTAVSKHCGTHTLVNDSDLEVRSGEIHHLAERFARNDPSSASAMLVAAEDVAARIKLPVSMAKLQRRHAQPHRARTKPF